MRKYIFGFFLLVLASIFIFLVGCSSTATLKDKENSETPDLNWACIQYDKDKSKEEIKNKAYPLECFGPSGTTKETFCMESAKNTFRDCFETCFVVNKFASDACQLECENDAARKDWSCKNNWGKI